MNRLYEKEKSRRTPARMDFASTIPQSRGLEIDMDASQIGKRAWDYAGVLRDAGLSCFEYVEQLTANQEG
jgi:hypothetical protein